MYQKRIAFLEESLRQLDNQLSTKSAPDLIDHKVRILGELSRLRRLQWDEDNERVNFDDEDR